MLAAVVVVGNRTVSALVRLIGLIEQVNPSTYQCVMSHRKWNAKENRYEDTAYVIVIAGTQP